MREVFAIAGREWRSLYYSPAAWVVLVVVQAVVGYLFLAQLDLYTTYQSEILAAEEPRGITELVVAVMLGSAGLILLMVVPVVTMRLFADERRQKSFPLLLSAPLGSARIVLGKYLGVLGFFALLLAMLMLMPLSLSLGTNLDVGLVGTAFLGLALMVASFLALGLYISSLTAQPMVAAIGSFGALLGFWLIDWQGGSATGSGEVLRYLSLARHYETFLRGVIDSTDVAYFLLFSLLFLALAVRRLDAERLGI